MKRTGGILAGENVESKTRTCPVCDETVPAGVKICPSCSTDLSLFSAESNLEIDLNDDALAKSILSEGNGHVSELLKVATEYDTAPPKAQPVELVYDDSIECPACGKSIPGDAASCSHCGAEFVVEEVFECPMCKALIDVSLNKCPSCGTEFEAEPPAPVAEPALQSAEKPPATAPPVAEPEPAPQPVSFVDRLKKIKDEPTKETPATPTSAQKKELSFAERMKAMKETKSLDETAPSAKSAQTPVQPMKPVSPQPKAEQVKPVPEVPKQSPVQLQSAAPRQQPQPKPVAEPKKDSNIAERLSMLKQGLPADAKPAQPEPAKPAQPQPKPAPADPEEAKKDAYKELPRYIGEVKKLLLLANELSIDVSTSKALINRAVTAGKTRDLDNAIKLVKEGKLGLERDLRATMLTKLRTIETALSLEKKAGKNVAAQEKDIDDVKRSMEASDFESASDTMKRLEQEMTNVSSAKLSEVELDHVANAIADAEALHLNVSEAKALHAEAASVADTDPARSSQLSKQASEVLNRILPNYIAGEMRKAKVTLREIKLMNVDITAPVNILKVANDRVLSGDYCAALGSIREFKEFVNKINS